MAFTPVPQTMFPATKNQERPSRRLAGEMTIAYQVTLYQMESCHSAVVRLLRYTINYHYAAYSTILIAEYFLIQLFSCS